MAIPRRSAKNMELYKYNKFHRVSALILAFGGSFWGMLLILSFPFTILHNVAFIPGWIIFFGWCYIAMGRSVNMKPRLFWIFSTIVNLTYLILHYGSWLTQPSSDKLVDAMEVWWIVTIVISLSCLLMKGLKQSEFTSISEVDL